MDSNPYAALFRRSTVAALLGLVAVVVCYYWIDRPVAFFVRDQGLNQYRVFKWLTYPPPIVETWAPAVLVLWAARRARGPAARWQTVLAASCLSLIVADACRESLGDACGRYWPATWHDDNPSLLGTGAYGFHPFVAGDDVGSFPSGHAARVLGMASVWWLAAPRVRTLLALLSAPLLASLVLMNYHFVGDVIGGSVLGGIVGAYAARLAGLDAVRSRQERNEPPAIDR